MFERPVFQHFAECAAQFTDSPAVDDGTTRLTYRELLERAQALGAHIADTVPEHRLVGVLVPNSAVYPIAWLGCLAARRGFLPLDPHAPAGRNLAIAAEADISAIVVDDGTVTEAIAARHRIIPVAGVRSSPPMSLDLPPAPIGIVVGTSGSTGRPKCIAMHERSILRKIAWQRHATAVGPGDRSLPLHSPATFAGSREAFAALLSGACLHVLDVKRVGLRPAIELLRRGGITLCATLPVVARALLATDDAGDTFRSLRILRLGGDTVLGSDIAGLAPRLQPAARILIGFGIGEAGGALLQRLIDPAETIEAGRISVGTPQPGQQVTIEDAMGNAVADGEPGILAIRSRFVALGYLSGGVLDNTAFPADPTDPDIRCYRSGDMFMRRADGGYVPLGRADRQVKINGMRVEPEETEAALRALPHVADAAVVVMDDGPQPHLIACVVPMRGHDSAQLPERLRTELATRLPAYQVPAEIRVLPAIPQLPSLKPDLAALRRKLAAEPTASGRRPR